MRKQNVSSIEQVISITELVKTLDLELVYEGRGTITIKSIDVSRPGLQLAGYYKHFDHTRVQVIGNAEYEFLNGMTAEERKAKFDELYSKDIPCLVFAHGVKVFKEAVSVAKNYGVPVLASEKVTTVLINEITNFKSEMLAPTEVMHGVLMDVFGVGILIVGKAGIGKSEIALELVNRGHRLVADDSVIIKKINEQLIGKAPENIRYYMEIRGLGIINVQQMFGPGSIAPNKNIDIIAELAPWEQGKTYDRIGTEESYEEILGINKQHLNIPVSPGRNIPIVLETAARKFRLKQAGYDPAKALMEEVFGSDN